MVSVAGTNTNTYTYTVTYNSASVSLDLNYFNFNSNNIANLLGGVGAPVMQISGFMNIKLNGNTFQNSGRYIQAAVLSWTQVLKNTVSSRNLTTSI